MLTRRIAYLLAAGGAQPGEILAITFTNKAAREMKERVVDLVGRRAFAMWVSTFHSMCVRILRAEANHLGMKSTFTIYDAADSQRLVQLVASGLNLDTKRHPARSLAAAISNLKNELIDAQAAADRAESEQEKIVAQVYDGYQARLKAASAFDFDDLIMQTVALLQAFPAVAEHYRRRFRHVLVDEYQDTNHAQYMLVRELVGGSRDAREIRTADGDLVREAVSEVPPAELVVVGDADQSIYAFRGATIRNITEFERDYPNARTIMLEQNYRSTQTILSAANAVISGIGTGAPRTCGPRRATAPRSSATSATTSTTRPNSSARRSTRWSTPARRNSATSPSSTGRTPRRERWRTCSSAPGCRTGSSAASGSTSARRSRMRSPTSGQSPIPTTRSTSGGS